MKKINTAAELLLEMNSAFKAAGMDFLGSEKALILKYLTKTQAEDTNKSVLNKFKRIGFKTNSEI